MHCYSSSKWDFGHIAKMLGGDVVLAPTTHIKHLTGSNIGNISGLIVM